MQRQHHAIIHFNLLEGKYEFADDFNKRGPNWDYFRTYCIFETLELFLFRNRYSL